jgi:hypothetical protein
VRRLRRSPRLQRAAIAAASLALAACLAHCSLTTSLDDLTGGSDASPDAVLEAAPDVQGEAAADTVVTPDAPARVRYARTLRIANGTAVAMPAGLTVRIPVDTLAADIAAGKILGDAADLRVVSSAKGARDRIIDFAPPGETPAVWVSLVAPIEPGATDTSYSLTYGGNDPAPPMADGAKVFLFFDDFNGAGLSNAWLKLGAPVVAGGMLTIRADEGVTTVAASDTVPDRTVLEMNARVTNPAATAGTMGFFYWLGFQRLGDFDASRPWTVFVSRSVGTVQGEVLSSSADAGPCSNLCSVSSRIQIAGARWYRVERDTDKTRFVLDGVDVGTIVEPTVDLAVLMRNFSPTSDLVVDWVRARALRSPPTVTADPEQIVP